jgi:hypothetical protein
MRHSNCLRGWLRIDAGRTGRKGMDAAYFAGCSYQDARGGSRVQHAKGLSSFRGDGVCAGEHFDVG